MAQIDIRSQNPFQWSALHSLIATLAVGACTLLCLLIGPTGLSSPVEIFNAESEAILNLRWTRVGLGLVAGAGLGAAGASLQTVLRNPLADPYIIGVSGGAALGGALTLCFTGLSGFLTTGSLVGAVGSMALLTGLARRTNHPDGLLLLGIVFNAFAAAVITFLKVVITPEEIQRLVLWLVGTVPYPDRAELFAVGAGTFFLTLFLMLKRGAIGLLILGDEEALRLGVAPERLRNHVYLTCCLLVGFLVPLVGMIGFVGLIVPHAMRLLLGPDFRNTLPASIFSGMIFLVLADALVRGAFVWSHTELPVGALTALIGAPAFAWLLLSRSQGVR